MLVEISYLQGQAVTHNVVSGPEYTSQPVAGVCPHEPVFQTSTSLQKGGTEEAVQLVPGMPTKTYILQSP